MRDPNMRELIDSLWRTAYALYSEKNDGPTGAWLRNRIGDNVEFGQAIGQDHFIEGNRSAAIGHGLNTKVFMELMMGAYATAAVGSDTEWDPTDRLSALGNGTDEDTRSLVWEAFKSGLFKFFNGIEFGKYNHRTVGGELVVPEDWTFSKEDEGVSYWLNEKWNLLGSGGMNFYIGYASDAIGTGFTTIFNPALNYIAFLVTDTHIPELEASDFEGLWYYRKGNAGTDGASAYIYKAYASDLEGSDFTITNDPALAYAAILTTDTKIGSPVVGDFAGLWYKRKGDDGAAPEVETFLPSEIELLVGTLNSGDIDSILTFNDSEVYDVQELAATPGYNIQINFTGIEYFNKVLLNLAYTNTSSHFVTIDLYNFVTATWNTIGFFNGLNGMTQFEEGVIDHAPYISEGNVNLRLYHVTSGYGGHSIQIDYACLQQALSGPQGRQGIQGKSAYQVALDNGFAGTQSAWLTSLIGNTGNGIASIVLTSTVGKVKTFKITFTDATTFVFTTTDGADGNNGKNPEFRLNAGWVESRLIGDIAWIQLYQIPTGTEYFEAHFIFDAAGAITYRCPHALKFTAMKRDQVNAPTLSVALNTNMAEYDVLTVTADAVGIVTLTGQWL